jgi:hypothetical protein
MQNSLGLKTFSSNLFSNKDINIAAEWMNATFSLLWNLQTTVK